MLNSAFLYSFQSNKETENQMFKIGLGRIGCLLIQPHCFSNFNTYLIMINVVITGLYNRGQQDEYIELDAQQKN